MKITQHRDGEWSRVEVSAPAKVNLFLAVGAVPKGEVRHLLLTVFQCLDLSENLRLSPCGINGTKTGNSFPEAGGDGDVVVTRLARGLSAPGDLDGEGNLVRKALAELRKQTGCSFPATLVEVSKNIPVAGGMAGGSADAAATLVGANALYDLGLSPERLEEIGALLGADVPAILRGGNVMGRRFGDEMTSLPNGPIRYWVLAVSEVGLSTPEVFREFDRLFPHPEPLPARLPQDFLSALTGNADELAAVLRNDLEAPALSLRPELRILMEKATQAGALRAIISGSGPTIACLCSDESGSVRVQEVLETQPNVNRVLRVSGPSR